MGDIDRILFKSLKSALVSVTHQSGISVTFATNINKKNKSKTIFINNKQEQTAGYINDRIAQRGSTKTTLAFRRVEFVRNQMSAEKPAV